jgi:hypothetical protein
MSKYPFSAPPTERAGCQRPAGAQRAARNETAAMTSPRPRGRSYGRRGFLALGAAVLGTAWAWTHRLLGRARTSASGRARGSETIPLERTARFASLPADWPPQLRRPRAAVLDPERLDWGPRWAG